MISKLVVKFGTLTTCFFTAFSPVFAQEEPWWFDVEVIVFDRGMMLNEVAEQFTESTSLTPYMADLDVISESLFPDISRLLNTMQSCDTVPNEQESLIELPTLPEPVINIVEEQQDIPPLDFDNFASPFEEQTTTLVEMLEELDPIITSTLFEPNFPTPQCIETNTIAKETIHYPFLPQTPVVLSGISGDSSWGVHILDENDHELSELSQRIRQEPKLTRLLHLVWRQPVLFGADNAKSVRIFGGQNYANAFDQNGNEIVQESLSDLITSDINLAPESIFPYLDAFDDAINQRIPITAETILARFKHEKGANQELTLLDDIWQIEGGIKVYLQYVNNVPYLHIDSSLQYRQPVPVEASNTGEMRLANIPFNQLRRVISTQLHYFDHPLFGVLIEIRRYREPTE